MQIGDRGPVEITEAAIDAADEPLHFLAHLLIDWKRLARGRADLYEPHPPVMSGIYREQRFEGAQALGNALGIVQSIDADDRLHLIVLDRQKRSFDAFGLGELGKFLGGNADGEDRGLRRLTVRGEKVAPKPLAVQAGGDVTRKILPVGFSLEANQIVDHQGAAEALLMRHCGKDLGRRKGRVEEKTDASSAAPQSELFAEGDEMIVVHPDGVARIEQWHERIGEAGVDAEIGLGVDLATAGKI